MNNKNLISKITTFVGASCIALSSFANVQWIDQTEVIVNDEVILKSDVEAALKEKTAFLMAQNQGNLLANIEQLRAQVIEELIERSILVQRAKRIGVNVSDQMLNEEIAGIAARNNLDLTSFVLAIEQQGQDYTRYRENIREQIMIQMLVRYEVGNRIRVSDAQADRALNAQRSKKLTNPEYLLLHKRFSNLEDAQNYYDTLTEEGLKADESATNLGYRKTENLPQAFVAQLDLVDERKVSNIIERSGSYHIIQVLEVRGDAKQSVTQHFARHILIGTNELRTKEQALELISDLRKQIVEGADFGQLAKEHSDDPGSAALLGELGWTDGSEMVVEFREAMNLVQIDEVSEVFESQFGYHILQVTKRRKKDLYDENLKNLARQAIGDKAFQEEYPRWLADLKAAAYIKFSNENDVDYQINKIRNEQ